MVGITNDIEYNTLDKRTAFITQITRVSWIVLGLSAIYQFIFFPEITNMIAIMAVVFAWLVGTKIWLQREMLERYLISTFTMLGYVAAQFYFPLVFTTIENKPLIYNLELPEQVFLHSTLCLLVLVVAHALYRFLQRYSLNRSFSLLGKAGFFDPPSHLQLWIMGFIGMAASFYVYFTQPDASKDIVGDPSSKFLVGLVHFSYAPFFIPLGKLYGNNEKLHKGFLFAIIFYAVLLFAISIVRNSRGAFILGLTSPTFAYFLGLLLGVFKTRIFTFKNFVLAGIGLWFLTGPLSDLGVAMLIARGDRNKEISASEQFEATLDAFLDKEAIEERKESDREESMDFDWDERYLDNIFTARLANIKFNDSNLITYSKVGQYDPDMQKYSVDALIASLPDPVIKMLNFDVDKEVVVSLSFGDYLYILSGGYGAREGFRIGHIAGTGMATFGWWYLLSLGLIVVPIFYLNDKFFRRKKKGELLAAQNPEDKFRFSFCGVLALTFFFQFLLMESVFSGGQYILRGWIQMVFLYLIIFHVSRLVTVLFVGPKKELRLSTGTQ